MTVIKFLPALLPLATLGTQASHYHLVFLGHKTARQFYLGNSYVGKANCFTAFATNKMNVVIVVMAFCAIIFAQGVQHRIIGGWYGVDNAFFQKSLQGTIHGDPVEFFAGLFFNIAMCQCPIAH